MTETRWIARRSVINARTDEDAAMGDWAADRSNWARTADDARTVLADRMDEEVQAVLSRFSFVSAQGVRAEARDHMLNLVRAAMRVRLDDLDGRQFDSQGRESGHVDVGVVRWSFYPVTVR